MRVMFVRHGMTLSNKEKRYQGCSDEHVSEEGIHQLESYRKERDYGEPDILLVSPLVRTWETSRILFPGRSFEIVENLKEMDFGDFEGKTYDELSEDPAYKKWMEGWLTLPFPNGESVVQMKERCCRAFIETMESDEVKRLMSEKEDPLVGFVVHGGTIMALLSTLDVEKGQYFDYFTSNGNGYTADYRDGKLYNCRKLFEV